MQQESVLVVLVALGLCKLNTILNRMVKAAQLTLGGFLVNMVVSRELNPETALKVELDTKCSIVDTVLQDYVKVA